MNTQSRPRNIVIIILAAFLAGGLIALALIVTGVVTFNRADSVPCNSLTSYEQVQATVSDKASVIQRIKDTGSNVSVEPVKADCPTSSSGEQLGYLRVTYADNDERDAIQNILGNEGLGVYVTLSRK